ncbi:MAG: cysteine desulfurase [Oscillospiraceae bacterium]|jgi:cysteine desulfurase|nr:cysteine desulfurase [Oscillospiraceae bacterium]
MIYVDNSATTPVSEAALEAMIPCFREQYGNPSAIYGFGQEAKKLLESSRAAVADAIGAKSSEIYFCSGGTESDNWAIYSACERSRGKGRHIVSQAAEHSAVLRALEKMEERGYEVTLLQPDRYGTITPVQLERAMRDDTILVSIMMANNVVGTVLPIESLCETAHSRNALFHTDAVQAAGHIPIDVRELGVDMLSMSAHKFHGPKGAGALFSKIPRIPAPYITGGGQEKGARSGTENIPGIVGMAAALRDAADNMARDSRYVAMLRDALVARVLEIPGAKLTGDPENRLPGHASFVFDTGKDGAHLINMLSEEGICASSGSACSASSTEAPHVLTAMGHGSASRSALRITLSKYNTMDEIHAITQRLPSLVAKLKSRKEASIS